MSKLVPTYEPIRLITGSSQVGLRKIQLFQQWVELNPPTFFYNFLKSFLL